MRLLERAKIKLRNSCFRPGRLSYDGDDNEQENLPIPEDIINEQCSIIFAHPDALLSKEGRDLMSSQVFQENEGPCVFDEAHCVELW